MARTKKHKRWYPSTHEKVLLSIAVATALVCTALVVTPAVASFGTPQLPDDVPLLRTFPLQP
jgi:hypothetical protein